MTQACLTPKIVDCGLNHGNAPLPRCLKAPLPCPPPIRQGFTYIGSNGAQGAFVTL